MSKVIGTVQVLKSEVYARKDGTTGYRVVGFTDDGEPVVFYRPAQEKPSKDMSYNMILAYDSTQKPVVRYQLAK